MNYDLNEGKVYRLVIIFVHKINIYKIYLHGNNGWLAY